MINSARNRDGEIVLPLRQERNFKFFLSAELLWLSVGHWK